MRMIFCSDYWKPQKPDAAYEAELKAAQDAGLPYSLINFEALVEQQTTERAVRRVELAEVEELALYRGWMLTPQLYTRLYQALAGKGLLLINTPAAYKHCHYLPEAYSVIAEHTPATVWLKTGSDVSIDEVMAILRPFGNKPVIVKDFVKSRKHEWYEACYIPVATDRQSVERVVRRFIELQGEALNEGLVFREFVELEPLTTHAKSGMPLTKEYRLFVLDGQIILTVPYWEQGEYANEQEALLPLATFSAIAQNAQSRFFTMDVAKRLDSSWIVVELGDGQVAGLPERTDAVTFYRALAGRQV